MVHLKCLYSESVKMNDMFTLRKLKTVDCKRQFRCNDTKRCHHLCKTFRPHQKKRLCPFRISHGEKHSGQSADMVCVKMGKTNNIDGFGTPALFFHCYLRSFSTVNQYTLSVVSCHHGSKPPVREGHHPAGTQQTNIKHNTSATAVPLPPLLPPEWQILLSFYHNTLRKGQKDISCHLYY